MQPSASGDFLLRVELQTDTNIFGEADLFVVGGGTRYYVDIGTPEKYQQAIEDVKTGKVGKRIKDAMRV